MPESGIDIGEVTKTSLASVPNEVAIERVRGGDTRAYEIIMRRHNQRLFRVARSILQDDDAAQDAVQEAYVSAFYKLDRYAPTGSFGAWLTRIAINEALMIKRKDRKHEKLPDTGHDDGAAGDYETVAPNANPIDAAANVELAGLIEQAVDRLPEDFRTVFVLRAIEQLSVQETAESLDINPATVKTRFHRARSLMQEALNQHLDTAGPNAFEFAGKRCDRLVEKVLERLGIGKSK